MFGRTPVKRSDLDPREHSKYKPECTKCSKNIQTYGRLKMCQISSGQKKKLHLDFSI